MRKLRQDDLVLCSGTMRRLDLPDTAAVASGAGYQGISVYLHEVRAACDRAGTELATAMFRQRPDDRDWGSVRHFQGGIAVSRPVSVPPLTAARSTEMRWARGM